MVSYDGSDNSDNALNFAIAQMNHKNDQLWILTVCERINASIYTHAYVSADFILDAQHKLEDHAKVFSFLFFFFLSTLVEISLSCC